MSEQDKEIKLNRFKWYFIGQGIGIAIMAPNILLRSNYIPRENNVQNGFVIPSKLEIKLEDIDNNGEKEVLMVYDGQNYLLRLDEQGKPIAQGYEVTPSRIIPK